MDTWKEIGHQKERRVRCGFGEKGCTNRGSGWRMRKKMNASESGYRTNPKACRIPNTNRSGRTVSKSYVRNNQVIKILVAGNMYRKSVTQRSMGNTLKSNKKKMATGN